MFGINKKMALFLNEQCTSIQLSDYPTIQAITQKSILLYLRHIWRKFKMRLAGGRMKAAVVVVVVELICWTWEGVQPRHLSGRQKS